MTFQRPRAVPRWLPWLDLGCAVTAGGLWYASSQAWPLLIAVTPWAIRLALTRRISRRTPLDLLMVLFLLSALLGIWVAFDRTAAWARFWLILGAVFLFYALANAAPSLRGRTRAWQSSPGGGDGLGQGEAGNDMVGAGSGLRTWFLALLGAAVAVVFVLTHPWQASTVKIGFITRLGQALQAPLPPLPDPQVNPNVAGAIVATLLPFAGVAALQAVRNWRGAPRPRPARLWLALVLGPAALLLAAFGLVMSASRGAWLAVVGAVLLAVAWGVAGWLGRGRMVRRGWIMLAWLALLAVAAVALVLVRPATVARLLDALPGPSAVGSRVDLWRGGLTLVGDYPFTGVGHDGFMMAYSTYVMLLHVGFAPHTHNLYLDLAVEQGLPALLLFGGMCLIFAREFWREQARGSAPERQRELVAAALSLAVILLHGLVDDPLYTSRAVLFLFVPLAFAGCVPAQREGSAPRLPAVVWIAGLVALLALAVAFRGPLVSPLSSNAAAVRQTQAELGLYTWPDWSIQDEVRRRVDLGPAIALYQRALVLNPRNASANRRLGQIELSLGQYEAALRHLQAAYAVQPWSPAVRQLLGEAYLANGQLEEGRALWATVSNEERQLDIRAWWYEHIGERERAAWMRQAAGSQP